MRQALSKGMLTAAAVTGILSVPGAHAFADADAEAIAGGSPGVVSGNSVSAPIHIPINVCGNTVDILAALNPATDNTCVNADDIDESKHEAAGPKQEAETPKPVHKAPAPAEHRPVAQAHTLPAPATLAETGGDPMTIAAAGLAMALLTGGAVLYRRGRTMARQ